MTAGPGPPLGAVETVLHAHLMAARRVSAIAHSTAAAHPNLGSAKFTQQPKA